MAKLLLWKSERGEKKKRGINGGDQKFSVKIYKVRERETSTETRVARYEGGKERKNERVRAKRRKRERENCSNEPLFVVRSNYLQPGSFIINSHSFNKLYF